MNRTLANRPTAGATADEPSRRKGPGLPLTDATRRLRRNLLVLSTCMCLIGSGIITLGETSFLGLSFDPGSSVVMNYLLIGLLGFWTISFLCYASIDLLSWEARGAPRGFFGFFLSPLALALEIMLPLVAAGFSIMALKPDLLNHFRPGGMPEIQAAVQSIRDERILDRAAGNMELASKRADLALTPQAAEQVIAEALVATRMDAELLSDASLLAGIEAELRTRLRQEHLHGILDSAQLAEFRQDSPAAIGHYTEALFFLMNDEIDDAKQAGLFAGLNDRVRALQPPAPEIELSEEAMEPDAPELTEHASLDQADGLEDQDPAGESRGLAAGI